MFAAAAALFAVAGGLARGPGDTAPPPEPVASSSPAPSPSATASPTPTPTPTRSPSLRATDRVLQQQLEGLVGSEQFATLTASVAVVVRDEEGRSILDVAADEPVLPASTMKVLTAAAALEVFGPDHRIVTPVRSTVPVDRFGYLDGDLVLVGTGDPLLATADYRRHVYPSRPHTPLEELADAVAATGLRWVTGDVVGDGTAWGRELLAPGWRDVYLSDHDARRIQALSIDAGLDVAVSIAEDDTVEVELLLSRDPARRAAREFAALLRERGVHVAGSARQAVFGVDAPHEVAEVASPPLEELLRFMMQRSDNPIADTLVRAIGAEAGDGSWAGAGRAVVASLERLGLDTTGVVVADGSGLSRDDRVTARLLADLDRVMAAGEHGALWQSLHAVAGETGTLRLRLRGTLAEGRFRGKTGTLDDVRSVVGSVDAADGRRLHVAVVANDTSGGDRWIVTVLMDELALRLAEHLDGCTRTPTGEPPESDVPPIVVPYELSCPAA